MTRSARDETRCDETNEHVPILTARTAEWIDGDGEAERNSLIMILIITMMYRSCIVIVSGASCRRDIAIN